MQSLQELCGSDAMTTSAIHRIWMAVLQNSDMLSMDFARLVTNSHADACSPSEFYHHSLSQKQLQLSAGASSRVWMKFCQSSELGGLS